MDDFWQEVIGFVAGTTVTAAALPRLLDIVRNHDVALNESYSRNALIAGGNFIWIIYGVLQDALAVAVMCGLSTIFNGMILVSISLARRRHARMTAAP
jgi:uncharacterized protein with PQ loop repeat